MTEHWKVIVDGVELGFAKLHSASDILDEQIFRTNGDTVIQWGADACARLPTMENPHRLRWAKLDWHGLTMQSLYCPTCCVLVGHPHDGYVYLDYPEEWLSLVDGPEPA